MIVVGVFPNAWEGEDKIGPHRIVGKQERNNYTEFIKSIVIWMKRLSNSGGILLENTDRKMFNKGWMRIHSLLSCDRII